MYINKIIIIYNFPLNLMVLYFKQSVKIFRMPKLTLTEIFLVYSFFEHSTITLFDQLGF